MADTKISALTASAGVTSTDEFPANDSGASVKVTAAQLGEYFFKRINSSSGAAGEYKTLQKLSANATANATVTLATVMTTTGLAAGTYTFQYDVIYQAAATTTGVDFAVGYSGTSGSFVVTTAFASTGGAAATGIADQAGSNTASMMEAKSQRTKATKVGSTLGVDTANSNCHMILRGIIVVTGAGDLTLQHASELAASTQVMADSTLELTKIG